MKEREPQKYVAKNKKAFYDYHILETIEAGIVLSGTEVKSIRAGKMNLKESYVSVRDGEIFLIGAHISPYEQGNRSNKDPLRDRKLLLHKNEIIRLYSLVKQEGLTIVPLSCYFKKGKVKIAIAVVRGKKHYDKRHSIAKRDAQKDIERSIKAKANQY